MTIAPIAPVSAAPARVAATPAARFGPLLEARLRRHAPGPQAGPGAPPLGAAIRAVEAAQARLDAVVEAARRGQAFTAGQLLALQADAYRLSQTLDVAGKLVEHGVQGVKQAIQTPL